MCRVPVRLREAVKERLAAAAEEIFELLERTVTEYEEEAERQRRLIRTLLQPRVLLDRRAAELAHRPPSVRDTEVSPGPPYIKEEQYPGPPQSESGEARGVSLKSEEEEVRGVPVKTEEEEAPETWTLVHLQNQSLSPTVDCPEPPVPGAPPGDPLLHLNNRPVAQKTSKRQRKPKMVRSKGCPSCGKIFLSKTNLEVHMRVHTQEKPFRCSVCGKRFSRRENMNTHMMLHSGLRPFSCTVCGKTFTQKQHLNSHFTIHTGQKPFSCSVCGRPFRQKCVLRRHMSSSH